MDKDTPRWVAHLIEAMNTRFERNDDTIFKLFEQQRTLNQVIVLQQQRLDGHAEMIEILREQIRRLEAKIDGREEHRGQDSGGVDTPTVGGLVKDSGEPSIWD